MYIVSFQSGPPRGRRRKGYSWGHREWVVDPVPREGQTVFLLRGGQEPPVSSISPHDELPFPPDGPRAANSHFITFAPCLV